MARRGAIAAAVSLGLLILSPLGATGYEESDRVNEGDSTHQALMEAIAEILRREGFPYLADYLRENMPTLKAGTVHADWTLWDSREHYMDPFTGEGLAGFRSARDLAREKGDLAANAWTRGDYWTALLNLGWVLHLIQDLTVPHHSRLTPLDYHSEYEAWVTDHLGELGVPDEGLLIPPNATADPYEWLQVAGLASYPLFEFVDGPDGVDENNYDAAATFLVPLAVRLSAGYVVTLAQALDRMPPVVRPAIPTEGWVGIPVEMSCLNIADDGPVASIEWTFSLGHHTETGAVIRPTFHVAGPVTVTLRVTDVMGRSAWFTSLVNVSDQRNADFRVVASSPDASWASALIILGAAVLLGTVIGRKRGRKRA